jgi:ribosomal protein S18 acetylase RimI-like enzyme
MLYGPLVEDSRWDSIADALYQQALAQQIIPPGYEQEVFVDVRHTRMAAFAQRHGFPARPLENHMKWERAHLARLPEVNAALVPYEPADADLFIALHDRLFPETYYRGAAILERLGEQDRLFISRGADGTVNGYIYAKIDTDNREGYIDYIGVAESVRRQGLGRALVAHAMRWLLTDPQVESIALTVMGENAAAIALYQGLGYTLRQTLVPYRKEG